MPRLQHVVIYVNDPVKAGKFYENLGLTKIIDGEDKFGPIVGFSDGHVNWTLMPAIEGRREGVDHLGFVVDDAEKIGESLIDAGGTVCVPGDVPTAEELAEAGLPPGAAQVTITDLAGVNIELGEKSWPH